MEVIGEAKMTEEAEHLGLPRPRSAYHVIGTLEITAAAGLLAGLARPALAAAAAAGFVLIMLGAVLSHHQVHDPFKTVLPALAVGALAVAALALQLTSP